MRLRSAFTAFAASYFTIVFLRNGSLRRLIRRAYQFVDEAARGARTITRIT